MRQEATLQVPPVSHASRLAPIVEVRVGTVEFRHDRPAARFTDMVKTPHGEVWPDEGRYLVRVDDSGTEVEVFTGSVRLTRAEMTPSDEASLRVNPGERVRMRAPGSHLPHSAR